MNKNELNKIMVDVQNGDEFAFSILYDKSYRGIFSFIYSYVNNYHTAEDLLQDTFIKVKQNAQQYKQNTNALAWMLQIAKNTTIDFLRKQEKSATSELNEDIAYSESVNSELYIHNLINEVLDQQDRQIVILHLIYNYKNREIAKILNMPVGTVLWRYNKAIKILRNKLEEVEYEK